MVSIYVPQMKELGSTINIVCRVRQFTESGLDLKWYENAKIARSEWKIAMRMSGKSVN